MIPGDDEDQQSADLMRGALGIATAQTAERRFNELGLLALKCAEAGVSCAALTRIRKANRSAAPTRCKGAPPGTWRLAAEDV